MKAMLLAAGRGNRLRPWTDHAPKPLLTVAGKPLIIHHIENLVRAGITDIIINLAYLGEQIELALGNGSAFGAHIQYSKEEPVLETGGGVYHALPLLGPDPFIVMNADIFTDFPLVKLTTCNLPLAHIILVRNPEHNPNGDYYLDENGYIFDQCDENKIGYHALHKYTFSGIGIYRPELFQDCKPGIFRLPTLFKKAMEKRKITGENYQGLWCDVGTIDRWQQLKLLLST